MGGKTSQSSSTTEPNPVIQQALQSILQRGQAVANQPLQQYQGPMLAGFTPLQQQAFENIEGAQGMALPFINQASQYATPQRWNERQLDRYYSPYQQNVIDSTMANINQTNAQQSNNLTGNAISSGAFGGDRAGVAQAALAGQQNMTNNATLAGLQNQGYSQALGQFNTVQGQRAQAANQLANMGLQAQNSTLQGAQAALGAGGLQQALAQQQLTGPGSPYAQFQQQQQYPFYTTNFLSGLLSGLGGLGGGTTTQTTPGPSMFSQVAGMGMAALPFFIKTGGRIPPYAEGGSVNIDLFEGPDGVFAPLPDLQPATLIPPPAPPPEDEQDMMGGGLPMLLESLGSTNSLPKMAMKKGFAKGGKAPQIDVSKFTTPVTPRTAENQPAGTYGMGDWFNPLPQIPLSSMPAPLVTPLPPGVVSNTNFSGMWNQDRDNGGGFNWGNAGLLGLPFGLFADGGYVGDEDDDWEEPFDVMPWLAETPELPEIPEYPLPPLPSGPNAPAQLQAPTIAQGHEAQAGADASGSSLPVTFPAGASASREGLFGSDVGADDADPRMALMAAGLAMMASPSPFPLQALGQGGLQGLEYWNAAKQAQAQRQTRAAQVAATEARTRAMVDHYEQMDQKPYFATTTPNLTLVYPRKGPNGTPMTVDLGIPNVNFQLGQQRTSLEAQGTQTYVGTDADGNALTLNNRTGQITNTGVSIRAKPSAAMESFNAKQQAWLAVHPGDVAGALNFANGKVTMSPEQARLAALNLAQRQYESEAMSGSAPTDPAAVSAAIQANADKFFGQITSAGPKPAAPAQRPVQRPTQRRAQTQTAPRRGPVPPPDAPDMPHPTDKEAAETLRAQARDAIARGADRNKVIQRLRGMGVDPSGL